MQGTFWIVVLVATLLAAPPVSAGGGDAPTPPVSVVADPSDAPDIDEQASAHAGVGDAQAARRSPGTWTTWSRIMGAVGAGVCTLGAFGLSIITIAIPGAILVANAAILGGPIVLLVLAAMVGAVTGTAALPFVPWWSLPIIGGVTASALIAAELTIALSSTVAVLGYLSVFGALDPVSGGWQLFTWGVLTALLAQVPVGLIVAGAGMSATAALTFLDDRAVPRGFSLDDWLPTERE